MCSVLCSALSIVYNVSSAQESQQVMSLLCPYYAVVGLYPDTHTPQAYKTLRQAVTLDPGNKLLVNMKEKSLKKSKTLGGTLRLYFTKQ